MRRPHSAGPLDRATGVAAIALAGLIARPKRPRTWRADLDALCRAIATLSEARRKGGDVDEPAEAIGFSMGNSPQLEEIESTASEDDGGIDGHPDEGMDVDAMPAHEPHRAKGRL